MKVSQLAQETANVVIHIGPEEDDNVTVVYRPGALTLSVADQLREVAKTDFQIDAIMVLLKPMLISWDLEDEEGNELPVTEDTIKAVPLSFLGALVEQMTEDNRPSREEGKALGDTSQQEGGTVTRLPGSGSFGPPSSTNDPPGN